MTVKQLKPSINANSALIAVIYPFTQSQLWQTFLDGPSAELLGMMTVSGNMLLHHSGYHHQVVSCNAALRTSQLAILIISLLYGTVSALEIH